MPTREEMRSLAEEIVGSYADRVATVAELRETVKMDLKGFQDSRTAMGKELRADLVKSVSDMKSAVSTQLKEMDAAHTTMSREMRANLAQSLADCKRSTGSMLKSFSNELKEVRSELAGGRDEWQILSATMQAQRVGLAVKTKPSEAVAAPAEEMIPETTAIRDRIFEYLANHPDGTKMTELEQEFRLARIQMAKVVKSLMDENKVEKRELFYFAI